MRRESEFAGGTQSHATREALKKLESQFLFQILNLAGKRGLGHMQSAGRAPVMLFLADGNEIPQVAQFDFDTLSRLVQS